MAALKAGQNAPDIRVTDAAGTSFSLYELWRDRPLVLVFLRHFG
jgi:peroxiredoxin